MKKTEFKKQLRGELWHVFRDRFQDCLWDELRLDALRALQSRGWEADFNDIWDFSCNEICDNVVGNILEKFNEPA